jgi:hypothetical protein
VAAFSGWLRCSAGSRREKQQLLRCPFAARRRSAVAAVAEYGAVGETIPNLAALIALLIRTRLVRLLAVKSLFITREEPGALIALRMASVDSDATAREAA